MTLPRRILPGQVLLVTRRCARRCFFFKPTARARRIMAFCLAHAVARCSIEIHAFHFSTTHPCISCARTHVASCRPSCSAWARTWLGR